MAEPASNRGRMFTFAGGGWVIAVMAAMCLALIAWAVAPALLYRLDRPPGDNRNIESYGFDLSNLTVPRTVVVPGMLHRDMVPAMFSATSSPLDRMQDVNDPKYGKYMVPSDKVIGVTINGESRAYPMHVLYVHEIVNDVLGGVPIAVTYQWPCDSTMVFDRRVGDRVLEFGVSGLVYNSNLLMYDRAQTGTDPGAGASLWSQLLARAVSGHAADTGQTLTIIPDVQVLSWSSWLALQPGTSVVNRDLSIAKRYKDAAPTPYFRSNEIMFPIDPSPPAGLLEPKTPVVIVRTGAATRVYPIAYVTQIAQKQARTESSQPAAAPVWVDTLGDTKVRFIPGNADQTVRVESDPPGTPLEVIHAYWFAWHATHPQDELVRPVPPENSGPSSE